MTFCFVYNARHRGGIGVVADRRLTSVTTFGDVNFESDEAQKILNFGKSFGMVFAGNLVLIQRLIVGLEDTLNSGSASGRLDRVRTTLRKNYNIFIRDEAHLSDPGINASLICFDARHGRGKQIYRIRKFVAYFDQEVGRFRAGWASQRGADWEAIGGTHEIQARLAFVARHDLAEACRQGGSVELASQGTISKLSGRYDVKSDPLIFQIDSTTGERLHKSFDDFRRKFGPLQYDYVDYLNTVASNAIQYEIQLMHERLEPFSDTISQSLHVARFIAGEGVKLSSLGVNRGL